jgi:hypothetical protein
MDSRMLGLGTRKISLRGKRCRRRIADWLIIADQDD